MGCEENMISDQIGRSGESILQRIVMCTYRALSECVRLGERSSSDYVNMPISDTDSEFQAGNQTYDRRDTASHRLALVGLDILAFHANAMKSQSQDFDVPKHFGPSIELLHAIYVLIMGNKNILGNAIVSRG